MGKPTNTAEYIASFPEDVRVILQQIWETIRNAAPHAEEAYTYGVPTFKVRGKNLVHFAAHKKHIGFYPTPSASRHSRRSYPYIKGQKVRFNFH